MPLGLVAGAPLMHGKPQKLARTVFGLLVAVQLLIPLTNAVCFQRRYQYPLRMVGYHLLVVGLAYSSLFGGSTLVATVRPGRWRTTAAAVLSLGWGLVSVALFFGYVLAWGGRQGAGTNLTPSMLVPYLVHPATAMGILQISPLMFWGILVGIPAAILAVYAAAVPAFSLVLLRASAWVRLYAPTILRPERPRRVLAGVFACILAGLTTWWSVPPLDSLTRLLGDPILGTLVYENASLPIDASSAAGDHARTVYRSPPRFQRKNVILIVLDACRADHLGVEGYGRDTTPFLSSLRAAGRLHVVHSFYSASCCTFGGILTLLRSQDWFKMSPRAFALQDVLKRSGYRVHFLLSGDQSGFLHLKSYYGQNLDTFSDGTDPSRHCTLNDDRGMFESFNAVPSSNGTPTFFYFHLMSSHGLGTKLTCNLRFQPSADPTVASQRINSYDNGVYQADRNIRELFHRLELKGYLQNSLVVITGDHGESLGERSFWGHAHNLYSEEVTPPLLIYDPDHTVSYRNLELARQVDVAPTILDRLGLPTPASWDGRSLLRDGPPRFSYLRFADTYAVIDHTPDRTLKYIYDDRTKKEEIYYLDADPHDHTDVFSEVVPGEVGELRQAVGRFSVFPGS